MVNGSACQEDHFHNGITNGAQWYELEGWCFVYEYLYNNYVYI